MVDKNGVEMRTGDVVEITGAYFKNDNGLYFIDNSPGDPSWSGSDYSLKKISKTGKISRAKHNICFWPISIYINDSVKASEAREWNRNNAQIEVKTIANTEEISAEFRFRAGEMNRYIQHEIYDWGEDAPEVQKHKAIRDHYLAVAEKTGPGKK